MPITQTTRLTLSKATIEDASFFFKLMNSPHWLKYIGDRNIKTISDAETHIKNNIWKSYDQDGFGFYTVRLNENYESIGICGLIKREQLECPDIGFAFLPLYEGKGYGYESSEAVLKLAKDSFQLKKIGAITLENNKSSIKLIEKLGLTFEKKINPFDAEEELLFFAKEL